MSHTASLPPAEDSLFRTSPAFDLDRFLSTLEPVTTAEEMRSWDAASVELGLSGTILMESAARTARDVLLAELGLSGRDCLTGYGIAVLAGSGNNGGDAFCLARMLRDLGGDAVVYGTREPDALKGDAAFHARLALACGVPFRPAEDYGGGADIVVDGVLGTGFSGDLAGRPRALVDLANARPARFTLALDIPSGLSSLTGQALPTALRADATATFAAAKPGLLAPWAAPYVGRLHVTDIGTPRRARSRASFARLSFDSLSLLAHVHRAFDVAGHKNTHGHVLVVGGAHGMGGAAHLSALSALRAGCGLVTVACPGHETAVVRGTRPEIMTLALGDTAETLWRAEHADLIAERLPSLRALIVGPGMGRGEDAAAFLRALLSHPRTCPAVLDADALTLMGKNPDLFALVRPDDVLTPHVGEARTLLGDPAWDMIARRAEAARELTRKAGCAVVLKGPGCVTAFGEAPLLLFGEDVPRLSIAGAGDCLCGVVAGLLAHRVPSPVAAALGVLWHARAGKLLEGRFPGRGNLASDLADTLPEVLAEVLNGNPSEGPIRN